MLSGIGVNRSGEWAGAQAGEKSMGEAGKRKSFSFIKWAELKKKERQVRTY